MTSAEAKVVCLLKMVMQVHYHVNLIIRPMRGMNGGLGGGFFMNKVYKNQ